MFEQRFLTLWTLLDIIRIKCVLFISNQNLGDIKSCNDVNHTYKP